MTEKYLKKYFESLILESSLFYSWSVGIRFEIGSSEIGLWEDEERTKINDEYFEKALDRAINLFDALFKDEHEIIFVYQQFSDGRKKIGKNNFYLKEIKNISEKNIKYSDVRKRREGNEFEKKRYCFKRVSVKLCKDDLNYKAIGKSDEKTTHI